MRDIATITRATARSAKFCASEVAEALGLSPWRDASPMRVWRRKRPDAEPEEETAVHLRGHVLERAVCEWYALDTGHALEEVASLHHPLVHATEPWLAATPDRLVHAPEESWLLEAKTSRDRHAWGEPGTGDIPAYYAIQVTVQMAALDAERDDVAVYFPIADEFAIYPVLRNRDAERVVIEHARVWWERHVVGGEPPPLDASQATRDHLLSLYPAPRAPRRDATPRETELAIALCETRIARQEAEAEEARLRAALQASIGDAAGIEGTWGRIDWSARKGAERLDAKRLRAEHPEIATAYTVRGEDGRTFTPRFHTEEDK